MRQMRRVSEDAVMYNGLVGMLLLVVCTVLSGISFAAEKPPGEITAFVSILPQAYFVERIGTPHVDIEVLVGPGQSPATYEPRPKQMAKLARSQVYFRIGVPFEKTLVAKISATFKDLTIVDTRKGVELRFFRGAHSHGSQAADPHIWLDPKRVRIQASTISNALSRIDSAHRAEYERNLRTFHADLDRVDAKIANILAPLRGKEFFVFHPSFGYFADSYGLKQVALQIEGKEPSAKQLASLIEKGREYGVKVIFVQAQFSMKAPEAFATAIGARVVPLDPLARDFLVNIERLAREIKKALLES